MGRAALAAKDAARAEQTWMKLLELDPRSDIAAQAHFGLAELYRDAGKSSEAEREMSAYRELKAPQGN
jgi:Tfp pilus assembly protein PilF